MKTSYLKTLIGLAVMQSRRDDSGPEPAKPDNGALDDLNPFIDDSETSASARKRYQEFGKQFTEKGSEPPVHEQVSAWYHYFAPDSIQETAALYATAMRGSSRLLTLLAFLTGLGAAAALFWYDGSVPINVLPVLLFFIFLPLLLLLISLSLSTLSRFRSHILYGLPGVLFNIVSLSGLKFSGLKQERRHQLEKALIWLRGNYSYFFLSWFRRSLHAAGAAYVAGALIWMLLYVSITDLAFAWSSTLALSAEHMHGIVRLISWPWQAWLPSAVPDFTLVEQTRFFRARDAGSVMESSSGIWWRFIFMSALVYGLLPRLLLFGVYSISAGKKLRLALSRSEQARRILYLMRPPTIGFEQSSDKNSEIPEAPKRIKRAEKPAGRTPAIAAFWNINEKELQQLGSSPDQLFTQMRDEVQNWYMLGGAQSSSENLEIIELLARELRKPSHKKAGTNLYIVVKYWESPRISFEKVLRALHQQCEPGLDGITLLPLLRNQQDLKEANRVNWQHRINRLHLPNVYMETEHGLLLNPPAGPFPPFS